MNSMEHSREVQLYVELGLSKEKTLRNILVVKLLLSFQLR